MKRNVIVGIAAGLVAVILAWFFIIYRPKGDDLKSVQGEVATEQHSTQDLQATLSRLQAQAKNASAQEALLRKFDQAIPKTPNLAEFIIQANDIADSSGVDMLSIAPAPPVAGGTASTIALNLSIQGSFFQVENYLTRLETLERLVIVDGITIGAGSGSSTGTSGATSASTDLSVTLTARMFTRAAPTSTAGGATAPSATTTTTVPGGASTTTAPTGSATTGGT